MILAEIEFTLARRPFIATLTDEGWMIEPDTPTLGRLLDQLASVAEVGPAQGDPATLCAHKAADFMGGKVVFVRPVPDKPDGADF